MRPGTTRTRPFWLDVMTAAAAVFWVIAALWLIAKISFWLCVALGLILLVMYCGRRYRSS